MKEKVAICYTCCGPTYRKTALEKLNNLHKDDPNIYYFVITDDKSYFKDVQRQNFVVNELKDFYTEYPELEKFEPFLESVDAEDYAKKFIDTGYKFPFSTMRFHLKQAEPFGVCNIALLGTDTDLNWSRLDDEMFSNKNRLYNAVGCWYKNLDEESMSLVADILKEKYNLTVQERLLIFDAAGRLYIFEDVEKMVTFFEIWNDIMFTLYRENKMRFFGGWYAMNDEYILAPIYDALGIKSPDNIDRFVNTFRVKHEPEVERFWLYNK